MTNEERIAALEKAYLSERFRSALINIELHIYKQEVCRARWGGPGGNDIGYIELGKARKVIGYTPWAPELCEAAKKLDENIAKYAEFLKKKDITMVSYQDTRMKEAFLALEEQVLAW